MLRQSQFDTLLIPMIYHHFEVGASRVPSMRAQLFSVQGSKLAAENGTGLGGMSPDAWDQYKNSGKPGSLDMNQLFTQGYTHEEYPVRISIEKKLLINDQYGKIQQYIRRVGISAEQKMEIDAIGLLNNAFASGTTWSDGKSLCATDHLFSPHSAATYGNKGTTALSEAALSATRILMMRFKDDKGNELGLMPNELWVPPELEDTALKIVKSVQESGTGNNAINPQNGRWTVKMSQRLTDANNWFVADSTWRQEVVNWYEREAMQVMLVDETTTHIVYEAKLHYSYGVDDARWIYGHEVA